MPKLQNNNNNKTLPNKALDDVIMHTHYHFNLEELMKDGSAKTNKVKGDPPPILIEIPNNFETRNLKVHKMMIGSRGTLRLFGTLGVDQITCESTADIPGGGGGAARRRTWTIMGSWAAWKTPMASSWEDLDTSTPLT